MHLRHIKLFHEIFEKKKIQKKKWLDLTEN